VATFAALLAPEIIAGVPAPYALFGHSTGALCAFEVAREIRRLNGPAPAHFFVAGRGAPQVPVPRTPVSEFSVAELADFLRQLGGTPEEILEEPELLIRFQPLLAADFSVCEDYTYSQQAPLDVPITAFAGTEDEGARPAQMSAWGEQTTAEFRMHTLAGGHFAVFEQNQSVLDHITAVLAATVNLHAVRE
jgi:surfactin synthase thioesterase subunit